MSETTVAMRPYRESDLAEMLAITDEAFAGVSVDYRMTEIFPAESQEPEAWKHRKRQDIIDDVRIHPEGCFVADDRGRCVGYVTVVLLEEKRIGRIPNLAVHRDYRGRGLGTRLLQHAMEYIKAAGMTYAKIETLAGNEGGQTLYPRFGFREVARQIHYLRRLDET